MGCPGPSPVGPVDLVEKGTVVTLGQPLGEQGVSIHTGDDGPVEWTGTDLTSLVGRVSGKDGRRDGSRWFVTHDV